MRIIGLILGSLLCLAWFIFIHFIKLMRMYLVLLDQKIEFKKFIFLYMQTTLVNLVIPFKIGELYRFFIYSKCTRSVQIGFFSVIVDRFFDTMALVLILLPLNFVYRDTITPVSVFLMVFVVLIVFIFWMFMPAYTYLNRYIIMNRSTKGSMTVLRGLEVLKAGYDYVKNLVTGRYALMLLLSFSAWILEGILLCIIARLVGFDFGAQAFAEYISSIMSSTHSDLLSLYTKLSVVVMAVLTVMSGCFMLISNNQKRTA